MWMSLLAALAFAGDELELPEPPVEDAPTGGGGAAGGFGSIGRGRATPPRAPEPAPLGGAVDAGGRSLPALARVRLGDASWRAGRVMGSIAVRDGVVLTGGPDGVARFDATGALVDRPHRENVYAVGFTPEGAPAWMGSGWSHGGLRPPCFDVSPWAFGYSADGAPVVMCRDGLTVGGEGDPVVHSTVGGGPFAISPDGREAFVWRMLEPGAWRVGLTGPAAGVQATSHAKVSDAAWSADGRLAVATREGVEIDGVALRGSEGALALAWDDAGARLAISTAESTLVVHDGRRSICRVALGQRVTGDVAWLGDLVLLGDRERTGLLQVDAAACALVPDAGTRPPRAVVVTGDTAWTVDEARAHAWDPATGARLRTVALEGLTSPEAAAPTADGGLRLVDAGSGVVGAVGPSGAVTVLSSDRADVYDRLVPFVLALDGGGPRLPTLPVAAAAASGHAAFGHERLRVTAPDGRTVEYDLRDQVDPDVRDPSGYGGMGMGYGGGAPREVSASWDPAAVRPHELVLVDLAWSGDGRRLAMLWAFLVNDAYGEERRKTWLGVLEPHSHALAGRTLSGGADAVALSADGHVVAWTSGHQAQVARIVPPEGWAPPRVPSAVDLPPEPPVVDVATDDAPRAPTSAADVALVAEIERDLAILLGSSMFGSGDFGSGDFGSGDSGFALGGPGLGELRGPLHRGAAQRLNLEHVAGSYELRGPRRALALSPDGRRIALGTPLETGVWSVDGGAPIWRHDLGQGGTEELSIQQDTLWITGADGTVLGVPLPE